MTLQIETIENNLRSSKLLLFSRTLPTRYCGHIKESASHDHFGSKAIKKNELTLVEMILAVGVEVNNQFSLINRSFGIVVKIFNFYSRSAKRNHSIDMQHCNFIQMYNILILIYKALYSSNV